MSAQSDELRNIIASLTNIVVSLEAEEQQVPVAPEVPAPVEATPEAPAAPEVPEAVEAQPEAAPEAVVDGQVADNTPSADVTVG